MLKLENNGASKDGHHSLSEREKSYSTRRSVAIGMLSGLVSGINLGFYGNIKKDTLEKLIPRLSMIQSFLKNGRPSAVSNESGLTDEIKCNITIPEIVELIDRIYSDKINLKDEKDIMVKQLRSIELMLQTGEMTNEN